jgi:hypothetical protein
VNGRLKRIWQALFSVGRKKNSLKRLVTGAAVPAGSGAAMVIAPAAAHAASYDGVCGSGYGVIDSFAVNGGTVFLTYNGTYNCVVTVRDTPGAAEYMTAGVKLSGTDWSASTTDEGDYTTYAGPRYVYAPGHRIDWGGRINGSGKDIYNSHCG